MDLPAWVITAIRDYVPGETCEVVIRLDRYKTGITRVRIGELLTVKPPQK